jgi:hypothetical protein
MSTLPNPLTIETLADLVADPLWRDDEDRCLPVAVVIRYGKDEGGRLWLSAVDLFEARACLPSQRLRSDQWLQIVASSHVDRGTK